MQISRWSTGAAWLIAAGGVFLNNAISSGRWISNQYPYNSNPDFMKYSQQ